MQRFKVYQIALLCLIVIVLGTSLFGCCSDEAQIKKVINKFYHQDAIIWYVEGENSHLVTPDYYCDVNETFYSMQPYYGTINGGIVDIKFEEINVSGDYATAKYRLTITNPLGGKWSWNYTTGLVRDGNNWKLSYTKAKPLYDD